MIHDPRYFLLIAPALTEENVESIVYIDAIVAEAMTKYLRPKYKHLISDDTFRSQFYPNVKATYTKDHTIYGLSVNLDNKVFCDPESPICR